MRAPISTRVNSVGDGELRHPCLEETGFGKSDLAQIRVQGPLRRVFWVARLGVRGQGLAYPRPESAFVPHGIPNSDRVISYVLSSFINPARRKVYLQDSRIRLGRDSLSAGFLGPLPARSVGKMAQPARPGSDDAVAALSHDSGIPAGYGKTCSNCSRAKTRCIYMQQDSARCER